jgi:hypothetical protein
LATSGSSGGSSPALLQEEERSRAAAPVFSRGACRRSSAPARIGAHGSASPGSALARGVLASAARARRRTADSTALSAKTAAGLTAVMSAPASMGPTTRDRFMDTPLSASACGICSRGTTCGTMAENAGQRMRQADAVGEGQQQQQLGRERAGQRHRRQHQRVHATPTGCVAA